MTDDRMIRDYYLVREMGSGASATVWHAIHRGIKPVALKVFKKDAANTETRQLFRDEVRTAMSFSHGSVVQVFDADEEPDGRMWIAMEWVDGISLAAFSKQLWLRGGKWPLDTAAYVIGRLLIALAYIHEFSIAGTRMWVIHRDVKPANVIISAGGEVKLTDFGVAKMWRDDTSSTFRGTFRYAAPEHYLRRATQQSDLFGAGAILHELLTNRSFRAHAHSDQLLYQAILDEEQPEPLGDWIPSPLRALHRSLLAPAEQRMQSARQAHAALMQWPLYRPGELGLGKLFREVMGRGVSSGVTMHDGAPVPEGPLPLRYRAHDTLDLAPLAPQADAPDAYRRRPTEIITPPAVPDLPSPADDSGEIRVTMFFAKPDPPAPAPAPAPDDPTTNLAAKP